MIASDHSTLAKPTAIRRWTVLVLVAAAVSSIFVIGTALLSLGPAQSRASVARWLDDLHIVGPRTVAVRAARRYEHADPVDDASRAVAAGDTRLQYAATLGPFAPGVPDESFAAYRERYGLHAPLYVGCVIESEEHDRYRAAAFAYAERYNQTVLKLVKR